jgi:hypothetical protein
MIQELFALLALLMRFVQLLILVMRLRKRGWRGLRWAEKSAAHQGERDGVHCLGDCYRVGIGCEQDVERAKENFLVAAEGNAMVRVAELFDKDDPQRFVWFGKSFCFKWSVFVLLGQNEWMFVNEMSGCSESKTRIERKIRSSFTGFVIGLLLRH